MIKTNLVTKVSVLLLIAVLLSFSFAFIGKAFGQEGSRKIVVWQKGVSDSVKQGVLNKSGAVKIKDLALVNASVVSLSSSAAEKSLAQAAGVKRVDDDVVVYTAVTTLGKLATAQPTQALPWGVDRVDAELVWPTGNSADPVKVAVVDTGISNTHPDLVANVKGGYNAINPNKNWNDDNGHGSHVAGTIGALNNTVGVIGVAPLVNLYAVKVLGANGSGFLSDVIEGIQWAVANGAQVINMSLGSSSDVQSLHDAVIAAYNAGVVVVAAAGNSGGAVIFPAAYPEAIAVSATDSNNLLASFSSRGPEVDLAAPGVNVYSTYKGTGYATLSGTSMATPHVTGSAALVLNTPVGAYDANANGKWDPAEVQKKLQDRAADLGAVGYDTLYGWGLINAYNAVQP